MSFPGACGEKQKAGKKTLTVHVVSHTHWDREWYHTAAVFRQRLVPLVNGLLKSLRADRELRFLLDGQAVVVEDYLDVEPGRRAEISAQLRSGRIEAGPWYVLADELTSSGEALLRNLLAGRRILSALGAQPSKVLYCPDSFGHPATLPSIATGFGCELIVLWRGYGGAEHPAANCVRWQAPDGSTIHLYHLPRAGYELGAELPVAEAAAESRWGEMRAALSERDLFGVVLLPNGADHHSLQESLPAAMRSLARAAKPDAVVRSSISDFAAALLRVARQKSAPSVQGELRDSYGYTWTLQGTFASRSRLKRSLAHATRLLTREAEPWSALATARGATSRRRLVDAAWKPLLLSLPHDTICGCSTDAVAVAAELRLESAAEQAAEIARESIREGARYDQEAARRTVGNAGGNVVLLCNPACRPRGGVAFVSYLQKRRDIKVGPGSAAQPEATFRTPVPRSLSPANHASGPRFPVQLLDTHSRYDLLESPHDYPEADVVMERRLLVWTPAVPPYGWKALRAGEGNATAKSPGPRNAATAAERSISNGLVSAGVTEDNRLWLSRGNPQSQEKKGAATPRADGRVYVSLEDCYDAGDLYTPSLRHEPISIERVRTWRIAESGPLQSSIIVRLEWASQVEKISAGANGEALAGRRARGRSPRISPLRGAVEITVFASADSALLRLDISGDNRSKHHRLRIVISGNLTDAHTFADAAFAVVPRAPIKTSPGSEHSEIPPATAPLHRFVSMLDRTAGMTVFSDGASEYESDALGQLSITLLRAVGELSRHDLPERPGHAGWPSNTPLAQEQGRFRCGLAWMPHGGGKWDDVADDVVNSADDFLHPLYGFTLRSAQTVPPEQTGVELTGVGLALSSIKESEDGESLVLRCVNMTSKRVSGSWQLGHRVRGASLARLDETPLRKLAVKKGDRIDFTAAPHAVVTILAKFK